jgi:uncharacterized tellurite resistance protein B-like protein
MLEGLFHWTHTPDSETQQRAEATIALATLLYQADGKVKRVEQDIFQDLIDNLPWDNPGITKETFHSTIIGASRQALEDRKISAYLDNYCSHLNHCGTVLDVLKKIAVSDGELDEVEALIIESVTTRIEAKASGKSDA